MYSIEYIILEIDIIFDNPIKESILIFVPVVIVGAVIRVRDMVHMEIAFI